MSKRIAAGILWFLSGWYLGAWMAYFFGISEILGPVLGIAAAAVFAGDPLGIIWVQPRSVVELRGQPAESDDAYAEAA